LPPDSLESVYNPHTSSHGLAGVEPTKLPLNALTSNQSNCNAKSFQLRQRAFFVDPYQAARARDIRRQNSRQSPLYVLAAQDAPPGSGKLNVHIAQLWADVRLCATSEIGQSLHGRGGSKSGHVRQVPKAEVSCRL
jgi:hypothetical protein